MDSRDKILLAIEVNKSKPAALPKLTKFDAPEQELIPIFADKLDEIGCSVVVLKDQALDHVIRQYYPEAERIFCPLNECLLGNIPLDDINHPQDFLPLDLTILRGQIGVAENGAIWVTEKEMMHRVSPFITEHLVLVLDRKQVVYNMHQAYERIKIDETGFGVFIAGPSKTADIEQSLVIGAQAARSLLVVLM